MIVMRLQNMQDLVNVELEAEDAGTYTVRSTNAVTGKVDFQQTEKSWVNARDLFIELTGDELHSLQP
jgi:hypothetical protein